MEKQKSIFSRVFTFYREGFRRMTWGRTLWLVVLLKLVILFGVLRVFFFKPAMAGLNDQQRSEQVFQNLTTK